MRIRQEDIQIRQLFKVKYLGLIEWNNGETMALRLVNIIASWNFFILKKKFFLHQHWNRIQTTQSKCMRFFLQSHKLNRISHEEFERLNWLPVTYRFKQCVNSTVFKYFNEQCPNYLNKVFVVATEINFQLRGSFQKLVNLLCHILVQLSWIKLRIHSSVLTILTPSNIIWINIS